VLYVLTKTLLVRSQSDLWQKSPWTCAIAAGLATAMFAVHPLRVEVVAWASCQPYLSCALFSMLAILAYVRAFESGTHPRRRWLALAFVLFVAALLSHAVAVSLPAVLVILDVYPLRRFNESPQRSLGPAAAQACREKIPFVLGSLFFIGLAIAARSQHVFLSKQPNISARIAQACYGTWFYLIKTAVPRNLVAVYPLPREIDWRAPSFMVSILGTLAISVGLFLMRRRWPGLLAVWLSYLLILAPNSGIIRTSDQIAADRYSYVAMLGWAIVLAAFLCRIGQTSSYKRAGPIGIFALALAALLGLVLMTRDQCRTWRDTKTLWNHALTCCAGANALAHYNMGHYLFGRGNIEAAIAHYTLALRLDPGDIAVHINMGVALSRQGKDALAAAHHAEALRIDPRSVAAHYNLGMILARRGKDEEAATHYLAALGLDPDAIDLHYSLGMILSRQGNYEAAAVHYKKALRLSPRLAGAHNNLGTDLARQGRFVEAEAHYAAALRLDPRRADTHTNLGVILSRQGKFDQAATLYAEALRLDPGNREAKKFLDRDRGQQSKVEVIAPH
jgi:Tfp pilus assembly protein PilF